MKVLVKALALTILFAAPAAAQRSSGGGNIHGTESRGEPLGSSYKASAVDPDTGYTPGYTGHRSGTAKVKKSKKKKVTVVR